MIKPIVDRPKRLSPPGINALKTHCSRGHEFTPANTYLRPDRTGRMCRECNRLSFSICSVEGCGKGAASRGWCPMHYARWRQNGDLGEAAERKRGVPAAPIVGRFWPKVDKHGPLPDFAPHLGPCWCWMASDAGNGYGKFDSRYAHRVAYELLVGPIPKGLVLDHLCRVPLCVRPEHLEPVTQAENARRGWWRMQTHCKNGHEWTGENTYWRKEGTRQCRACCLARKRRDAHERRVSRAG